MSRKQDTIVFSLGGSLLFKNGEINVPYVRKLKKLLLAHREKKFVLVVGGGGIARIYMDALHACNYSHYVSSHIGIKSTRLNALVVAHIFGKITNLHTMPKTVREIIQLLKKHRIVCAGGLRYADEQTTDSSAAQIARRLNASFINLTDVEGLYTSNPQKNKRAKIISTINYDDFYRLVKKLSYKPGQHFVLDQHAASMIKKYHTPTYIISGNLTNLKKLLQGQPFVGTSIGK